MEDLGRLDVFTQNLRWLAKARDSEPQHWGGVVVNMTRNTVQLDRAMALLDGKSERRTPTGQELEVIASMTGLEVEELATVPLFEKGTSILRENMIYLIDTMPKGQKELAAREIGISPSQFSRWKTMAGAPRKKNLCRLLKFHGLDQDIDLELEPLFLSLEPLSAFSKKAWVASRLNDLPASEVSKLYPAFEKLLKRLPSESDPFQKS